MEFFLSNNKEYLWLNLLNSGAYLAEFVKLLKKLGGKWQIMTN